jgi:(S)-ureidoglycine-glyoxylate aminotransferase
VLDRRRSIEAGLRAPGERGGERRIRSNYFDLAMILDYWGPKRLNHHTEATSMLYGARECARVLVEEGLETAVERHRLHGEAMLAGVQGLGLTPFGDLDHRMTNIVGVEIPDGVVGDAVRGELLEDYGIEIGTSFGPLHGRVWRIGTMGVNARRDAVLTTLAALEQVLRRSGLPVPVAGGTEAALDVYGSAA